MTAFWVLLASVAVSIIAETDAKMLEKWHAKTVSDCRSTRIGAALLIILAVCQLVVLWWPS